MIWLMHRMVAKWITGLCPQLELRTPNHAEFVICY
jgi:hypothetical protein